MDVAMPKVRERRWARRLLALLGWRVEVVVPPGPRCVVAVYPHTSNWDFFVGYLAKLAIAPEGTRSYVDHWKSGFYRLAVDAKVPIGLGFIDWRERVVGLTTYLEP